MTAALDRSRLHTLAESRLLNGDRLPVPPRDQRWLVEAAESVKLLGRGGAAFPVAAKLSAARRGARVLANGGEGEPLSWKDRALMRRCPHLVVAGVAMTAAALRSRHAVIAVSDAYAADLLTAAAEGTSVEVRRVGFGFVGGEIGALVNGLDGRAPVPNGVRVHATERGLGGRPTYASNVETFAQLALLSALGPEVYAAVGAPAEPGVSLLTLHGTERDGVWEVPNGTDVRSLIGGDLRRPVLVGGYHGTWTTESRLSVDRLEMRRRGIRWGAGVLAVLPEETCALGEIARVARWLASRSAGQCGPCRFGLPAIVDDLARLAAGAEIDVDRLSRRLGYVHDRGACHHPTGAVAFMASGVGAFESEVRRHLAGRPCGRPVLGVLPLGDSA
ncbi:NADH-ubiquinone oxidoreductase-F iron-sulfur binding region domain-containing protein [Microbacterium sp. X-17]|uniref:NADH-ubiquinone oxidoreductase-F iron-sulfur binding region domain-containing protein n=1 Tax=Microbacterium sp. X-17 TaxID=3144404 RepID=UPI0031F4CC5C